MSDSLRPHGLYSPWNSSGQNIGVGSLSLLQRIFPTQGLNPSLLHCGRILYQLSHSVLVINFVCKFPGASGGKASAYIVGALGTIPGSGRSPGEGNGNPLQYSCQENPMDGGTWWAIVLGIAKGRTRLSDFTFTFVCKLIICLGMLAHSVTFPKDKFPTSCNVCWASCVAFNLKLKRNSPGPLVAEPLGHTV